MTSLLLSSLAALVLSLGYRLLWRSRYGSRRGEGRCVRGRVVGPAPAGTPVCRTTATGEILQVDPFELEEAALGRRLVVTPGLNLRVRGRRIVVGDLVTMHALPTTTPRAEAGYREAALRDALAPLRISRGAWPELRVLNLVLLAAALVVASSGSLALASYLRALHEALDCPPWTVARGARPPAGDEQWCELSLPDGVVQRHGPYVRWAAPDRVAESGQYVHEARQGSWTSWDGEGHLVERVEYRDDEPDGELIRWWPGGQRVETRGRRLPGGNVLRESFDPRGRLILRRSYSSASWDELHGPFAQWHPNGRLVCRTSYRAGVLHGTYERWLASGQLVEQGEYRRGKKCGRWSVWDETGRLLRSADYADNERGQL